MTKTYALLKLLEHGPLTKPEIREITGWTDKQIRSTLMYLSREEKIRARKKATRTHSQWELTQGSWTTT